MNYFSFKNAKLALFLTTVFFYIISLFFWYVGIHFNNEAFSTPTYITIVSLILFVMLWIPDEISFKPLGIKDEEMSVGILMWWPIAAAFALSIDWLIKDYEAHVPYYLVQLYGVVRFILIGINFKKKKIGFKKKSFCKNSKIYLITDLIVVALFLMLAINRDSRYLVDLAIIGLPMVLAWRNLLSGRV
jgi:hypothetical protein